MRVVVCGGGVVGACLAYFLSLRRVETVVVEGTGVACAASGKSGGFLALDWCDGTPLAPLARRSFLLHAELAACLGNPWGHRPCQTLAVRVGGRARPGGDRPGWLGPEAGLAGRLGTPATTAVLDPARFTKGIMEAAIGQGAGLRTGRVEGLTFAADGGTVTGVVADGAELPADAVVIAMGPWSALAGSWLPLPAVHGLKGNSLLLAPVGPVPEQALFAELAGEPSTPELFPRADGTFYVCGLSSAQPLPVDPAEVAPDPKAAERLRVIARAVAPALGEAAIVAAQACYRPVTEDGLPLLGRVPGTANAFVATGHGVWGMLNAPASGEAMAELVAEGRTRRVDLAPFDPARLPPAAAARGRARPTPTPPDA